MKSEISFAPMANGLEVTMSGFRTRWIVVIGLLLFVLTAVLLAGNPFARPAGAAGDVVGAEDYAVLAWNDLGMHCYNQDFQDLAVLPPYNTLWAQVVRVGDPPQIVTSGIEVTYFFADNSYSVGKSNFWDYDIPLFGVDLPLNVGLAGKGMAGSMDLQDDHFIAEGIPLTEFSDSDLTNRDPYQLATIIAIDTATGSELARTTAVAPVSTEMKCDDCHYDGGIEDIATGRIETNILTLHDKENVDKYPAGHEGALMNRRPILCAECHASNALGAPGVTGIPNLSRAIHDKHKEEMPSTVEGCYQCHPGPETQCLRDVMSIKHQMGCEDCHGDMQKVAENGQPWVTEPRCDNVACHGSDYAQDQVLYRNSKEHGGVYCAACHDSPHAIAPGREAKDGLKFVALQGFYDTLKACEVCHTTAPAGDGPHGVPGFPLLKKLGFLPFVTGMD